MKPTPILLAASVATAALCGCAHHPFYDSHVRRLQADQGLPHLPPEPATPDHTIPKPIPLAGVLIEMPSGKTIRGVENIIIHARRAENDDDGSGKDAGVGFTGLVTTIDLGQKDRPEPNFRTPYEVGMKASEVTVAMPIGIGVLRGIRPRLTTAIISGGAEGSTIIVYAGANQQWMYLAEYTPVGSEIGDLSLLSPTGAPIQTEHFNVVQRLIVVDKNMTGNTWTMHAPEKLADKPAILALCQQAWIEAQNSGLIPATDPFPNPP
jgi:hypothetical protein